MQTVRQNAPKQVGLVNVMKGTKEQLVASATLGTEIATAYVMQNFLAVVMDRCSVVRQGLFVLVQRVMQGHIAIRVQKDFMTMATVVF